MQKPIHADSALLPWFSRIAIRYDYCGSVDTVFVRKKIFFTTKVVSWRSTVLFLGRIT